jgi:hypothetical protein
MADKDKDPEAFLLRGLKASEMASERLRLTKTTLKN